jgi:hypothetical protein
MSADDILRLHYQERQFLGASDFDDEQAYLIESRHRNNVGQRTWGILSGLEIKENPCWRSAASLLITPRRYRCRCGSRMPPRKPRRPPPDT